MLQRDNKADAYSPLSALAKHQSCLSLHGGKLILLMFHTKFRSLIGFLCILLIITVTVMILLIIIVKKVNFSGPLVRSFCNLDPNVWKSLGN